MTFELSTLATQLLAEIAADPAGVVSPSVYETGRILDLAPWLPDCSRRLAFLAAEQNADGSWGGPGGYGIVPTLSAVDALLAVVSSGRTTGMSTTHLQRLTKAASRGLWALVGLLGPDGPAAADMIATELIVPALVEALNARLSALAAEPVAGLEPYAGTVLPLPVGTDPGLLDKLRANPAAAGSKLRHTLEVLGGAAGLANVQPANANLGCSPPAATAAWLNASPGAQTDALAYLLDAVRRGDGPVAGVTPITMFEHAWSVSALLGAGIQVPVPDDIRKRMTAALTREGVAVGAGLLCDADTTATTLTALATLGDARRPDVLLRFDTGEHFQCWQGERNPSISANGHVLHAIAGYLGRGSEGDPLRPVADRLANWLVDQQQADGSWLDKWHASPYYATAVCVRAVKSADRDEPIRRASRWVLDTQRDDGSWGVWGAARPRKRPMPSKSWPLAGPPGCSPSRPSTAARSFCATARENCFVKCRSSAVVARQGSVRAASSHHRGSARRTAMGEQPVMPPELPDARVAGQISGRAFQAHRRLGPWLAQHASWINDGYVAPVTSAYAYAAPWLTSDEMDLALRFELWVFGTDELVDSRAQTRSEVDTLVSRWVTVAHGAEPEPTDLPSVALADILARLRTSPLWTVFGERWRDLFENTYQGMVQEWAGAERLATTGHGPKMAEYVANSDSCGFRLIRVTDWLAGGDHAAVDHANRLLTAAWHAEIASRLTNDLASHQREADQTDLNAVKLGATAAQIGKYIEDATARCDDLLGPLVTAQVRPALWLQRILRFGNGFYQHADFRP
ncbi:terpene synthase family protein [Fodinicola feengrottensis]|nr:prenyltransferase/squalene oxidase repeat-containing protein [Fodinicola feengrottensis]